jgi:hypothetical protein
VILLCLRCCLEHHSSSDGIDFFEWHVIEL